MCKKKETQNDILLDIWSKCKELSSKYDEMYSKNAQISFKKNDDDYKKTISNIKEMMPKIVAVVIKDSESVKLGTELLERFDQFEGKYKKEIKGMATPLRCVLENYKATTTEEKEKEEEKKATGIWKYLSSYLINNVKGNTDLFLGVGDWGMKILLAFGVIFAYLTNQLIYQYDLGFYCDGWGVPQAYISKSNGFTDFVIHTIVYIVLLLALSIPIILMLQHLEEIKLQNKRDVVITRILTAVVLVVLAGLAFAFFRGKLKGTVGIIIFGCLWWFGSNIVIFYKHKQKHLTIACVFICAIILLILIILIKIPEICSVIWKVLEGKTANIATVMLMMVPIIMIASLFIFSIAKKDSKLGLEMGLLLAFLLFISIVNAREIRKFGSTEQAQINQCTIFSASMEQRDQCDDLINKQIRYFVVAYESDDKIVAFPCEVESGTVTDIYSQAYLVVSGEDVIFKTLPYASPETASLVGELPPLIDITMLLRAINP